MTIHHDKLAYGKLAASHEDLSEERILEMLGELEEYGDEDRSAGAESDRKEERKRKTENKK